MSKAHNNVKSNNYLKDREAFLKELKQFNDSKGISLRPPVVNGQEIDLYQFYLLVTQRGGVYKVNQQGGWDLFLRPLHLPHPCINGSALLRRIYGMHLERFERARCPHNRDDDNDLDDDPRRGRGFGTPRITPSIAYASASADSVRSSIRMAGPSERLALSLLSPMPNEQDFAINVCTVLAADYSNRLPLSTTPHILDFLLAHAGVYNHASLRETIGRSYHEARGMYPDEFWKIRAGGGGAKELVDESMFPVLDSEQPELMVQALAAHNTLSDLLQETGEPDKVPEEEVMEEDILEDWVTEPSEEDLLFAPEMGGGARCVYTQRILQVASIVRSLSFHDENIPHMSRHTTLLRFLLLCANSWVGALRQTGLDTLGNVCQELIIKEPATCLLSRHILSTIQAALVAEDRARKLAALELLNKLAQNEANEEVLLRSLEGRIYSDVCSLLTLRDIMVLVCTLECVYALTSLGERACEHVARVTGLVHTLVSLVTVEAQSYGPKACILMRVVETVSGVAALTDRDERAAQPPPPERQPQPVTPVKNTREVEREAVRVPAPSAPPPPAPTPVPAAAPAPSPVNNVQQQHLQQQQVQENEQFALAWLRAAYEPMPMVTNNSGSEAGELYRQYLACCRKVGRKGVIAPLHFPRLVRSVFGGMVGPNPVTNGTENQEIYIGIRSRNPQNRNTPPAGPASPILKAQLTNKPEPVGKPAVVQPQPAPAPPPPAPTPHLSQPLDTAASNTTLIKHLLAHKVSSAPPPQVAQRQQNQQRLIGQQQTASAVVVQANPSAGMDVDPEALIKCTTITSGGVASSIPLGQTDKINVGSVIQTVDESLTIKDEQMQMMDEATQLTIKQAQNKMLADLLEKKSNPPVQVVQMSQQMNAPTIQITETGQIVQIKHDNPVIQINESGQLLPQQGQFVQIKNDQGQIIHLKNDQGQIIHLKNDQGQIVQIKGDQLQGQLINQAGQIIQIKNDQGQFIQIKNDGQMQQNLLQGGQMIQIKNEQGQLVQIKNDSQLQHNLMQGGQMIQIKNEQGQLVQIKNDGHMQQNIMQAGQMMQGQVVQPHLLQAKSETEHIVETVVIDHSYTEPPNKKQKTEHKRESNSPQESVSKTAANLYAAIAASALEDEEDLMVPQKSESLEVQQPTLQIQQPTLQVQQPTLQVQQPTLQVQQPTMQVQQPVLQVQPMDMQNIMCSQAGQLILQEKPIVSQNTQYMQQPMQIIATPSSQGGLSYITQNIPGNMMQQHKTIIIVQGGAGGGPITLTNSSVIQSGQRVMHSQPTLVSTQSLVVKQALSQNPPQLTASQQPIITSQPQPHKTQIVTQPQQIMVAQKPQPTIITSNAQVMGNQNSNQIVTVTNNQQLLGNQQIITGNQQIIGSNHQILSGNQQILTGNQQILSGNQQILTGNPQYVTVSGPQQIIMNTSLKQGVHRVVQQPQRNQAVANVQLQPQTSGVSQMTTLVPSGDSKNTVIQSVASQKTPAKPAAPVQMRQVITRQPVMVGSTKIGEKEVVVQQPVSEAPPLLATKPAVPVKLPAPQQPTPQEDTPWICHWRGCGRSFDSASGVFSHAARAHCPSNSRAESPCLWTDCDRVPRRTFALLNHLHDRHCTADALKAIYMSRRQAASEGDGSKSVSLGYPPNAALAALNKHAVDFLNPRELMDDNEGPVTKSIRLTAALILRNIVIYSNNGRRQLRSYEPHLAHIALSTVEASRTIAQVLYDMNNI